MWPIAGSSRTAEFMTINQQNDLSTQFLLPEVSYYLVANHCEYRIHSLDEHPRPDPRPPPPPPTRRGWWLQSAAPETGPSSVRARRPRRRHHGHGGDPRAEARAGGAGAAQGAGGGAAEGQEVSC